MLSAATLQSAASNTGVRLRSDRGPRVVYAVHSADCSGCRDYIRSLIAAADDIAEWDGRLTVVVGEPLETARRMRNSLGADIEVLADEQHASGLAGATLIVADEWGEEKFSRTDDESHAFPDPQDVVEWVRFTAIQCEECERPEGEWRSI